MKSLVIDRAVLTELFVKLSSGRVVEIDEQLRFFERFDIVYFDQESFSFFGHVLQHSRQQNILAGFTPIDHDVSRQHTELSRKLLKRIHPGLEDEPLIVNAMDRYGAESSKGRPEILPALEYIFYLVSLCRSTGSSLLLWRARAHVLRALVKVLQLDLDSADEGSPVSSMILKAFPGVSEDGCASTFRLKVYLIEDTRGIPARRGDRGSEGVGEADVFVSYARPDRDFVANLVKALEDRGFEVWWDDEIRPGRKFSASIQRALDAARAVLVVWSESSILSDWVRDEASVGKERDKLIAIALDEVKPPLGFRQFQTIDMRQMGDWRDGDAFETLTAELTRRSKRD
jgi:TIR domain